MSYRCSTRRRGSWCCSIAWRHYSGPLDAPAEVILVDDGSDDGSFEILCDLHERDPRFKVIRLSRNFGHQTAITAGMDLALGDAIIVMDADLQDPPEVVLEMAQPLA